MKGLARQTTGGLGEWSEYSVYTIINVASEYSDSSVTSERRISSEYSVFSDSSEYSVSSKYSDSCYSFFFFSECSDSSEYSVSSKYSDSCSQKHDNLLRMRYGSALIGNGRRGHVHKRGCHAV